MLFVLMVALVFNKTNTCRSLALVVVVVVVVLLMGKMRT